MAYGKIKADTLTWDNAGTDVDVTISTLPTAAQVAAKADTGSTNTFTAEQVLNAGLSVDGPYEQAAETMAALDVDCSTGNYFKKSISTSSSITFSNIPATGTAFSFVLELTLTGTATAITWPDGTGGTPTVYWNGDAGTTAPTLTDARTHLFMFTTSDGGTTVRGAALVDYTA